MLRCLVRPVLARSRTGLRLVSSHSHPSGPHDNDSIKKQLELDPNLEGFFDDDIVSEIKQTPETVQSRPVQFPDPSEIPILDENDPDPMLGSPSTITTEQFLRQLKNQPPINEEPVVQEVWSAAAAQPVQVSAPPEAFNCANFDRFVDFLHRGDVPTPTSIAHNATLDTVVNTELPLAVVSRFNDPRLNLSIERYIYKNLPDQKKSRFAKRLVLYRNSPCIVLGKNQNPYKEINFHMANLFQVPILRRYSGGGTVVHDLGNVNFSFMTGQSMFTRTGFTNILTDLLNGLVGTAYKDYQLPSFELTTNAKGDMVRASNMYKVSGSAYQLSKGTFLHHGTMLLNVNLKMLGSLLRLSPERRKTVEDRSIESIPSPVENMGVDPEVFEYSCVNAFGSEYGVPSFLKKSEHDNVDVFKFGSAECQVLKVDDFDELPQQVIDEYNTFKSWDWVFGRTPRFHLRFNVDDLEVVLQIDHGKIQEVELSRDEPKLAQLQEQVGKVAFRGDAVAKLIPDESLRKAFAWNIDNGLNYERLGIE